MSNKLVAVLIVAVLSFYGYQANALIPVFEDLLSKLIPVAEANTSDSNLHTLTISDGKQTSVGALRSPSAHSRADRTCYYCHGFHGDKYRYTEGIPSALLRARISGGLESPLPNLLGDKQYLRTSEPVRKSNTSEVTRGML